MCIKEGFYIHYSTKTTMQRNILIILVAILIACSTKAPNTQSNTDTVSKLQKAQKALDSLVQSLQKSGGFDTSNSKEYTESQIFNLDAVLMFLNARKVGYPESSIVEKIAMVNEDNYKKMSNWRLTTFEKLRRDNYVIFKESGNAINPHEYEYHISFEGIKFLSEGGYEGYYKRLKEKERLDRLQIETAIDTNKSVKDTNELQKWLIGATVIISILSMFISYLAYKKSQDIHFSPVLPAPTVIIQEPQEPQEQPMPHSNIETNLPPETK